MKTPRGPSEVPSLSKSFIRLIYSLNYRFAFGSDGADIGNFGDFERFGLFHLENVTPAIIVAAIRWKRDHAKDATEISKRDGVLRERGI